VVEHHQPWVFILRIDTPDWVGRGGGMETDKVR